MTSFGTPFFWVVKVREADRAMRISLSEAVSRLMRVGPMKSWTSPRVKGEVSDGESVYSPGRRRKKNAMMIMSATASKKKESGGSSRAMVQIRLMTAMGMGLTRVGGGSAFFQAAIIRWILKSMSPAELIRGSPLPTERCVCATLRK